MKTILAMSCPVGGGIDDAVGIKVSVPGNQVTFAVGKSGPYVDDGSGVGSHWQKTPQPGLGQPGPWQPLTRILSQMPVS